MELSRYLVSEPLIGLLAPRWVRASVVAEMTSEYLEGKGYKVYTISSQNVHEPHDVPIPQSSPIVVVYTSLVAAMAHPPSDSVISILVIEWGFDYPLLSAIAENKSVRYLRFEFLHAPRSVRFNAARIPITSSYATWYSELTKSMSGVDVKSMAGNYFYRDMTPADSLHAMVHSGKYTYDKSPSKPGPHITHVRALGPGGMLPPSPGATLMEDSPKLHYIANEARGTKILILTSFRFAFGMTLIQKVLTNVFGRAPWVVDPTMTNSDETIREFNEATTGILISSTVPPSGIVGVTRVLIVDDYNPTFVVQSIYSLCVMGCGTEREPLGVTLLTVSVPSFIAENTYEEDQANACITQLSLMAKRYDAIEQVSAPVVIDVTELTVLDKIVNA